MSPSPSAWTRVRGHSHSSDSEAGGAAPPKASLTARALATGILALQSLGAIYGDIGTSPLYVYTSIFPSSIPTERQTLGAASCIFWGFTIIVLAKYGVIVLLLGPNNGEGGQVALYAKLARTLHVGPRGVTLPGELEPDDKLLLTNTATHDSQISRVRHRVSGWFHETALPKVLMGLCFFGCSLVFSDGLLTPTTSVLSAIGGIAVAAPSLTDAVLPISCGVLIALFMAQQFGSGKLSTVFAPIVLLWLLAISVVGIINITKHPAIFRALSPSFAIEFLRDQGNVDILGGVMLSMTGVEAMFADVGHFGRLPVQLSLSCVVYPALMLAYLGQGAYIILDPASISNAFFLSIPGGINTPQYWFIFVLATLATVIASQALILGVFSILRQLIHIDCFPAFRVRHTSHHVFGQVYIPVVNYMLMIGVVLTTVGFQNSANVTAAYGLGISLDFFVTTTLVTLVLVYVYEVPWYLYMPFFLVFAALDMCFIVAGVRKVPDGAWFPLTVAIAFTCFITFWRWARSLKVDNEYDSRVRVGTVFDGLDKTVERNAETLVLGRSSTSRLFKDPDIEPATYPLNEIVYAPPSHRMAEDSVARSRTDGIQAQRSVEPLPLRLRSDPHIQLTRLAQVVALVHTNVAQTLHSPNTVPRILAHLLNVFPGLPEHVILLGNRVTDKPFVADDSRVDVHAMRNMPGFYRCVVRFGFMDSVHINHSHVREILGRIDAKAVKSVCHVIESERVYARRRAYDGNWRRILRVAGEYVRTFGIEQVFSPLDRVFEQKYVAEVDADDKSFEVRRLYVGSVVRL
ncbi:potassium transporter [Lipomyces tetrasporus]|uniref:Potassium transporter n=1 Tax=Lipomyces tetrasporus TaxID=54092 RepID=A0AAD7VRY1_9ASCO|nr:potassium transporter [Lipomyces tetrasporus]KAJ8099728.1 potassium transporter [Lipomyces tetrasporus]